MSIVAFDVNESLNWLFPPRPKKQPDPILSLNNLALVSLCAIAFIFRRPFTKITLTTYIICNSIKLFYNFLFPYKEDTRVKAGFTKVLQALKKRQLTNIIRFDFDNKTIAAMIPTLQESKAKTLLGKLKVSSQNRTIPFLLFKMSLQGLSPFQIMFTESIDCPNNFEIRFYSTEKNQHLANKVQQFLFPSFKGIMLHHDRYRDPFKEPFAVLGSGYGNNSININILHDFCHLIATYSKSNSRLK